MISSGSVHATGISHIYRVCFPYLGTRSAGSTLSSLFSSLLFVHPHVPAIPSCISLMRYSTSFLVTHHKHGAKYPFLYNTPLCTTKDGALIHNFRACLSSCGNFRSIKYSIITFLLLFNSSTIDTINASSIALVWTISTNTFLVKCGNVEDDNLLNVSTLLFFDSCICSNLKYTNYFVSAFTLYAYCAMFFP